MDCIFCKLANGEIPTDLIYENELIACFRDANPQTDVHVLIVPKKHYRDIKELSESGQADAAAVLTAIPAIAEKLGVEDYRLINNCGKGAGQSVFHVHFHLMSDASKLQDRLI